MMKDIHPQIVVAIKYGIPVYNVWRLHKPYLGAIRKWKKKETIYSWAVKHFFEVIVAEMKIFQQQW